MDQTWEDIEKVGLADDVPEAVQKLTRTVERLSMSRFFCSDPIADPYRRDNVDSWMVWASIAALPSPADGDPIHQDMASLGLSEKWKVSPEREKLYNDPLVATLFEVRNFGVHVAVMKNHRKNFVAHSGEKDIDLGSSVYILPIVFEELSVTRNIRSGTSKVDQAMIAWFNRQAESWPAGYLIGTARKRIVTSLEDFLAQRV